MSTAATQYYGYLLTKGYSPRQVESFVDFANRAVIGVMSPNQAYKRSLQLGWLGADGYYSQDGEPVQGERTAFRDWIQTVQEKGWIDKGINLLGGLATGEYQPIDKDELTNESEEETNKLDNKKESDNSKYLIGGLIVLGIGVSLYYGFKNK